MSSSEASNREMPEAVAQAARRFIQDFSGSPPESIGLANLLSSATKAVAQSFAAQACTIRLLAGDHLDVGVAWGYKHPVGREHPIRIDERLKKIVVEQEPLRIFDLLSDPQLPPSRRARMESEGFRGYVGVPMIAASNVEGILSLYFPTTCDLSDEEIESLRAVADCLAHNIQRIRRRDKPKVPSSGDTAPPCAKATILVVDDEAFMRLLFEEALSTQGYHVVALTGTEAIRYLEQNNVRLVVTDLQMPDVSGWEVADAAKRRCPDARVIMVSGSVGELTPENLRKHQIDLGLPKPCSCADLFRAVSSLCPS